MPQAYSDPKRASDPHALPDVEVFYVGTAKTWRDVVECYVCSEQAVDSTNQQTQHGEHVGWYWASCFPGCLWDGDPVGPFETEAEALADAREGADE